MEVATLQDDSRRVCHRLFTRDQRASPTSLTVSRQTPELPLPGLRVLLPVAKGETGPLGGKRFCEGGCQVKTLFLLEEGSGTVPSPHRRSSRCSLAGRGERIREGPFAFFVVPQSRSRSGGFTPPCGEANSPLQTRPRLRHYFSLHFSFDKPGSIGYTYEVELAED